MMPIAAAKVRYQKNGLAGIWRRDRWISERKHAKPAGDCDGHGHDRPDGFFPGHLEPGARARRGEQIDALTEAGVRPQAKGNPDRKGGNKQHYDGRQGQQRQRHRLKENEQPKNHEDEADELHAASFP